MTNEVHSIIRWVKMEYKESAKPLIAKYEKDIKELELDLEIVKGNLHHLKNAVRIDGGGIKTK